MEVSIEQKHFPGPMEFSKYNKCSESQDKDVKIVRYFTEYGVKDYIRGDSWENIGEKAAAGAGGAVVGSVVGMPLGPVGSAIGSYIGEKIGTSYVDSQIV